MIKVIYFFRKYTNEYYFIHKLLAFNLNFLQKYFDYFICKKLILIQIILIHTASLFYNFLYVDLFISNSMIV